MIDKVLFDSAYLNQINQNTSFGAVPAVQFRDMIGGATFIICVVYSLLHQLFTQRGQKEEVMPMLITKTINQIKTIVPIVTFAGWVAYIDFVIQSYLLTGAL